MVHFKILLAFVSSVLSLDQGYSYTSFIDGNGAKYGFNVAHDRHCQVDHKRTDFAKGFDEFLNGVKTKKTADSGGFTGVAFSRSSAYNGSPHNIHDRSYKFHNFLIPSALEYGHMGYPPSKNSIFHSPKADLGYGSPAYGNSRMIGLGYYGNTKYKKKHQWLY